MSFPSPPPGVAYPMAPHYWYPPPSPPHPTTAFVLSLLAGVFIILVGVVEFLLGWFVGPFSSGFFRFLLFTGVTALGMGVGILVLAFLLDSRPEHHTALGVGIVILSLASILGGGGGLVGLILGVIGGCLAIAFSPHPPATPFPPWGGPMYYPPAPPAPTYYSPVPPGPAFYPNAPLAVPAGIPIVPGPAAYTSPQRGRPCPKCGRMLAFGAKFCSYCGTPAQ
ncbi:MAG: zinc ribbon domain-containing protein [Thermoplasmata archaeon]|nr:zinc ribbon domain-containing protein [Thermoplasmata archaeon]MCI4359496.1 zinc ribbon domain-containing protein [Thermoplasmata archaeon]